MSDSDKPTVGHAASYGEPWKATSGLAGTGTVLDSQLGVVFVPAWKDQPSRDSNAKRTVACVNELAGIEFEEGAVRRLILELKRLEYPTLPTITMLLDPIKVTP